MENILINIDSEFRDQEKYKLSTAFVYVPNDKFKNVKYIRVSSAEIPNVFWEISDLKANNYFHITIKDSGALDNKTFKIKIKDGSYTSDIFGNYIDNIFQVINGIGDKSGRQYNLKYSFDEITCKVTISNLVNGSSGGQPFSLDFTKTQQTPYKSLGRILGFIQLNYDGISESLISITAEDLLDVIGDSYCFLRVNDYGKIYNQVLDKRLLAKIILDNNKTYYIFDNKNFITKEYVFPQPVNIEKFYIELLDKYGNLINLQGQDFSFTLELGLVENSKLYLNLEKGYFG